MHKVYLYNNLLGEFTIIKNLGGLYVIRCE